MTLPESDFSANFAPDPNDAIPEEVLESPVETETDALEAAPDTTPAAEADPYGIRALAQEQREFLKLQREQVERQNAPQPQAAPKPLMQQEDWTARYDAAAEASSYDPGARQTMLRMNQELAVEAARDMQNQLRTETQAQFGAEGAVGTLRTEARSVLGDLIPDSVLDDVTQQVFGGNRALMGTALQDPAVRQLVIDAAAGRQMRAGKAAPTGAPARTPPPANLQSSARDTKASRTQTEMWGDTEYVDRVFADAWSNPGKYGAKK